MLKKIFLAGAFHQVKLPNSKDVIMEMHGLWTDYQPISLRGVVNRENLLILTLNEKSKSYPKISCVKFITVTCRHTCYHEKWIDRMNLHHLKFAGFTVLKCSKKFHPKERHSFANDWSKYEGKYYLLKYIVNEGIATVNIKFEGKSENVIKKFEGKRKLTFSFRSKPTGIVCCF